MPHQFHIPVMGTCFTSDSPIRVAHLGIDSAISLVDDRLLEQMGLFFAQKNGISYERISKTAHAREIRIRNYLNLVNKLVRRNFAQTISQPFDGISDKSRYFQLLPTEDPLRIRYLNLLDTPAGKAREDEERRLTAEMRCGSIDVNIMVKLDRPGFDDAKEALRGYATSDLCGNTSLILSAGLNQSLFAEMEKFPCFYRNAQGNFDKRIVLKISDFRSAMIQGKFLARKGLEVSEFRIESGLNCGGHLFPSDGELLPTILQEFSTKRESLETQFQSTVERYYAQHGLDTERLKPKSFPIFSVQGGIGCPGEMQRLLHDFKMDRCGWGSPFLLVPEATAVDSATRKLLAESTPADIVISHASPLGVPFSNLRTCSAEHNRLQRILAKNPGAPCAKGFLQNNTEFTERPICTASREYQVQKLRQIDSLSISESEKTRLRARILEKSCICHELGNSALIEFGVQSKSTPVSVCPGPNIAYFNRTYSLEEMVDFIYGRGKSLVSKNRPHMFAREIQLYQEWLKGEFSDAAENPERLAQLQTIAENLKKSSLAALEIAQSKPYPGENLESIRETVKI